MKTISTNFCAAIEKAFNGFLAESGFIKTKARATDTGFSIIYRKGELYIGIGGTLHSHDYPYYSWLTLGQGSDEMPETDWNAISLWRIVQETSPDDFAKEKDLYNIATIKTTDQIVEKVDALFASTKAHATSFIKGDLDLFYRLRARLNAGRQPYIVYTPKAGGGYTKSFEKISSKLKERFSK